MIMDRIDYGTQWSSLNGRTFPSIIEARPRRTEGDTLALGAERFRRLLDINR